MKWLSLAAASALLVSGCAVAVYPGPKRPATETARIVARGESSVRSIDGLELPIGSEFTVLPGLHAITMGSGFAAPKTSCFKAQAGHSYSVALEGVNHEATISVTDVGADAMARAIEVALGGTCAAVAAQWDPPPRPAPRPVAPAPAAREEAPVVAAADDDGEDDGEDQPPAAPAKPAPPPARAPMAVDFETPRASRSASAPTGARFPRSTDEEEDPLWARHPGNGPIFELGAFLGGTDLASTYDQNGNMVGTLSGGSGVVLGFGWMWTPLWAGDGAGFGFGGEASLKYDSITAGNSSVSLLRFPVALTAHTFLHLTDRYWILLRGGVQKELGVDLSVSGYPDASMTGSPGALGEVGLYYVTHVGAQRTAVLFAFRYTSGSDSNAGATFSSSSGGLIFALQHNL